MTAFDTDVLSVLLSGAATYDSRLTAIPPDQRMAPVVAAAEVLRGWLAATRTAEAGKGRISLDLAFRQFERSLVGLADYHLLSYTPAADALFRQWRAAQIRVGTQDLRIAAVAVAHNAKLATRNARDFGLVPGLNLEIWP